MTKYLNAAAFVALTGLIVALFVLNDSLYSGPDVRIFLALIMILLGLSAIWMVWKRKKLAWLLIASIFFGTSVVLIGNFVVPTSILMRIAGSFAFSVIFIPAAALLTICWRAEV